MSYLFSCFFLGFFRLFKIDGTSATVQDPEGDNRTAANRTASARPGNRPDDIPILPKIYGYWIIVILYVTRIRDFNNRIVFVYV